MKKLVVVFTIVLSAANAFAQIGKHSVVAGLDVNYEVTARDFYDSNGVKFPDNSTLRRLSVSPNIGFFLSEKIMLGASVSLSRETLDDDFHGYTGSHPKTTGKSLTIYARHYSKLHDRVYFFLQGDITWGKSVYETEVFNPTTGMVAPYRDGRHFFQTGLRPGIVYFVTPRFGLESTIGFVGFTRSYSGNDEYDFKQSNITNSFGVNLNSSNLRFGFRFYLRKQVTEKVAEN